MRKIRERIIALFKEYVLRFYSGLGLRGIIPNFRVKSILKKRPLMLTIETVNICNSRCVFCAYTYAPPEAKIMDMSVYKKALVDYQELGGGYLELTPVVGEFFLDPFWKERLLVLSEYTAIKKVSVHTNAIKLADLSEQEMKFLLERCYLRISLGGLNKQTTKQMFGVDVHEKIHRGLEKLFIIREKYRLYKKIILNFRINYNIEDFYNDPALNFYMRKEVTINVLNSFGNWGGKVSEKNLPSGAKMIKPKPIFYAPCFTFYLGPEVLVDGRVTACGCMDYECKLQVGDIKKQTLKDIWESSQYEKLRRSFMSDSPPMLCKGCSYYIDGEFFSRRMYVRKYKIGDNPFGDF